MCVVVLSVFHVCAHVRRSHQVVRVWAEFREKEIYIFKETIINICANKFIFNARARASNFHKLRTRRHTEANALRFGVLCGGSRGVTRSINIIVIIR